MSYNRLDDRTIDDPILLALFHQEVIARAPATAPTTSLTPSSQMRFTVLICRRFAVTAMKNYVGYSACWWGMNLKLKPCRLAQR